MNIIETDSQGKHQQEWLNSGVDEEIIALNARSLPGLPEASLYGTTPYEYLLYSPKISRRNDGRLRDRDLKKYQHIELGGWWCSGVDPLNNYVLMMWGCFKPDHPRRDRQKIHKFIKYEHPFREETRAFFLLVPNRIWVKVSNRSGIPITEFDLQHPGGFWHWVWRHNVPVTIVEGVKKAGALLTAGYAAIAIPGVNAGYRTPQDEYGTAIGKPSLIPDLKHFATQGRQINICFDQDNKPETVQRVRTAISRMGRLLVNEGCSLRVIDLPFGQEKGVDDFIVAKGQSAFDALYNTAVALELWEIKLFTLLTYPPAIALNQRFLGQLLVREGEKLIILKAPKGTGKTEWLATEVAKAHDLGRRVLIITHRIQLGEALCNRFGVNYVTEVRTNETGTLLGYGVCVDSPTELKKLQDTRAKTKTERHQQRKAELSRRYEVEVTPDLVEKDDDGWYPQLRMHYYLTLGREFLTNRDAKRAKTQLEAGENSIWKPDFNKGQLLPAVLLLESLNLLQFLTPDVQLRGSDEKMLEFKALAVKHRHVIKNYLNVSISEKLTPVAIAQKLLAKIDLKLDYVGRLGKRENRECVYQFVAPDDERDSIFGQWLNRDEAFSRDSVSVSNNISTTTPVIDTAPHTPENIAIQRWKGLMVKMQLGLNSAGNFYSELVSKVGEAVGVADGEPYWNAYLGQWQVWVNFAWGCTSVVCDWLVAV